MRLRHLATTTLALAIACSTIVVFVPTASSATLTGITEITPGCALMADATATCWGGNNAGNVGDGTTTDRALPVVVQNETGTGPLTGITQIAAGGGWRCALLADQTARCWGSSSYGQLGAGSHTGDSALPLVVQNESGTGPLTGIARLELGGAHTCALLTDGTARCWGDNESGELGNGSTSPTTNHHAFLPVVVKNAAGTAPLAGITQLAAGNQFTCALLTSATARCWGENTNGQLGDNTTTRRLLPVVVKNSTGTAPLSGIAQLAAGLSVNDGFACARLTNGTARCWGGNPFGQLGDGTTVRRPLPVVVQNDAGNGPLAGITDLRAGGDDNCAQLTNGSLHCWGNNDYGQLGDGTYATRLRPVLVKNALGTAALGMISSFDAGYYGTCARVTNGTAMCWGSTEDLGDGSLGTNGFPGAGNRPLPSTIKADPQPLTNVAAISESGRIGHACALLTGNTAACWGANITGQLGDGTHTGSLIPIPVSNPTRTGALTGIVQIVTGADFTCARMTNFTARCWGNNATGQLGDGTTTPRILPVPVKNGLGTAALTNIAQLSAATNYACARLFDGTARCWGANLYGQLGDGTQTQRLLPVAVKNGAGTDKLTHISQLVAGANSTCVALNDTTARCWGNNGAGQLGDGTQTQRLLPVVVKNETGTGPLMDVSEFGAGIGLPSMCARLGDNTARCWGSNVNGQLGDGTTFNRFLPVVVKDGTGTAPLSNVIQLTGGYAHACALLWDQTAQCWGANGNFQLGDATHTERHLPVVVKDEAGTATLGGISQLSAATVSTCAGMLDGTARCWGSNRLGVLGNVNLQPYANQPLPIAVLTA